MPYLTSSQTEWVKVLALITMIFDHVGVAFSDTSPYFLFCRIIGRFSFLAFGFVIALNLSRDNVNFSSYFSWMFITALSSEMFFKLFYPEYEKVNVLFQFFAVIGVVWVYQNRQYFHFLIQSVLYALFLFISFHADYSWFGLLYCLACYLFFQTSKQQDRVIGMLGCVLSAFLVNYQFLVGLWRSGLWFFIILSVGFTLFYLFSPKGIRNNKLDILRIKKLFFYAFYPLHLLMVTGIKYFIIS